MLHASLAMVMLCHVLADPHLALQTEILRPSRVMPTAKTQGHLNRKLHRALLRRSMLSIDERFDSGFALNHLEQIHPDIAFSRAMISIIKSDSTLIDYFYGGHGGYGTIDELQKHFYFRTTNCGNHFMRGGSSNELDLIWQKLKPDQPCLWENMPPMKLLSVISIAKKLNVTHIIESGRLGGLSAYIYSVHGFKVTSIEVMPIASVESDLTQLVPDIQIIDNDGAVEVPKAVQKLTGSQKASFIEVDERLLIQRVRSLIQQALDDLGSDTRIALVLDGPKGSEASMLAQDLMRKEKSIVFTALDDQWAPGNAAYVSFNTQDPAFRREFPMSKDRETAKAVSTVDHHFFEDDVLTILLPAERLNEVLKLAETLKARGSTNSTKTQS